MGARASGGEGGQDLFGGGAGTLPGATQNFPPVCWPPGVSGVGVGVHGGGGVLHGHKTKNKTRKNNSKIMVQQTDLGS